MPSRLRRAAITSAECARRNVPVLIAAAALVLLAAHADPAFAQDPFAEARQAACATQQGLTRLAGAVGIIGMTACLLLGYFNKLNWRWLATGIGVSFFINTVPSWVMSLAGGGC